MRKQFVAALTVLAMVSQGLWAAGDDAVNNPNIPCDRATVRRIFEGSDTALQNDIRTYFEDNHTSAEIRRKCAEIEGRGTEAGCPNGNCGRSADDELDGVNMPRGQRRTLVTETQSQGSGSIFDGSFLNNLIFTGIGAVGGFFLGRMTAKKKHKHRRHRFMEYREEMESYRGYRRQPFGYRQRLDNAPVFIGPGTRVNPIGTIPQQPYFRNEYSNLRTSPFNGGTVANTGAPAVIIP